MLVSNPSLSFWYKECSRFLSGFGQPMWDQVMRGLHHILRDPCKGLVYKRRGKVHGQYRFIISVYVDADYNKEQPGCKSTTGIVIFINGNIIKWKCSSQASTSRSTVEAEYLAMSAAVFEVLKVYNFLVHIVGEDRIELPIEVFSDNKGAISEATMEHGCHTKHTGHIANAYHFFRQHVQSGFIRIQYVESANNIADLITKALAAMTFEKFAKCAMDAHGHVSSSVIKDCLNSNN